MDFAQAVIELEKMPGRVESVLSSAMRRIIKEVAKESKLNAPKSPTQQEIDNSRKPARDLRKKQRKERKAWNKEIEKAKRKKKTSAKREKKKERRIMARISKQEAAARRRERKRESRAIKAEKRRNRKKRGRRMR